MDHNRIGSSYSSPCDRQGTPTFTTPHESAAVAISPHSNRYISSLAARLSQATTFHPEHIMYIHRNAIACLLSAAILFTAMAPAFAGDPAIEKLKADAPVTVAQDARFFTLDNGIVKAVINNRSGQLQNLYYK